jgi:hypothetical protein
MDSPWIVLGILFFLTSALGVLAIVFAITIKNRNSNSSNSNIAILQKQPFEKPFEQPQYLRLHHANTNTNTDTDTDTDTDKKRDAFRSEPSSGPDNVDCSVTCWFSTPCEGDCWNATRQQQCSIVHTNTGAGAPCPPLTSNVDCSGTMPCVCKGEDLALLLSGRSLTTCTDCSLVAPGNACYFVCEDTSLTPQGVPEAMCVNGTWEWAGLPATCAPAHKTCPTVPIGDASAGCANSGIVVSPLGICSGAVHGDFCSISCMSGYSVAPSATAGAVCFHGSWSLDANSFIPATLACAPQANCTDGSGGNGGNGNNGDTCAPGGSCPRVKSGEWGHGWTRGITSNLVQFS